MDIVTAVIIEGGASTPVKRGNGLTGTIRVAIGPVPGADWRRVANERGEASHSVRVYRNRCGPEDVVLLV
jgi:hypothetical protein